jgi:hypothetical protein
MIDPKESDYKFSNMAEDVKNLMITRGVVVLLSIGSFFYSKARKLQEHHTKWGKSND